MLAARALTSSPEDPIQALGLVDVPIPLPDSGWTRVQVKAAGLNHHDVWTLRGVGRRGRNLQGDSSADGFTAYTYASVGKLRKCRHGEPLG